MRPLIGLALGSGVARGWAHIGVLRALDQAELKPDIVAGTSIGALIGGAYLSGHLDHLEAWALRLNRLKLSRMFDFQLGGSGVIAGRRVLRALHPAMLHLTIEELPLPFVCIATDLASGHEVWLRSGNLVDALRASYAVPGLFPPVKREGRWLIDGALANPVPVSVCRAMGAHITVAVNLNGEAFGESPADDELDLVETVDSEPAGAAGGTMVPSSRMRLLRQFFRRSGNEPSVFAVMARSLNIVQDRIARSRLAGDPPDVMIFPRLGDIGILEFHRAEESIAAGEAATQALLPRLRQLVQRLSSDDTPWSPRRPNGRG
ncbi:MAG TPA: patatin-like phospholipase family protein [Stellaceae bacterium]|jgi:NTE family protein|nr:patatin-like phospholipase family protein [Stellaceae bacterium]